MLFKFLLHNIFLFPYIFSLCFVSTIDFEDLNVETANDKSNATDLIESVVATEDKDYPELALVGSVDSMHTKWCVSYLHCKYSCGIM